MHARVAFSLPSPPVLQILRVLDFGFLCQCDWSVFLMQPKEWNQKREWVQVSCEETIGPELLGKDNEVRSPVIRQRDQVLQTQSPHVSV